MISDKLDKAIREVPDFPKPGINFKDITTILLDPELSIEIIDAFIERLKGKKIDVAEGRFRIAERDAGISATLATACSAAANEASILSAKNRERALAAEALIAVLSFERDRHFANATAAHAEISDFHVLYATESIRVRSVVCGVLVTLLARELSAFKRWVYACGSKLLGTIAGTQQRLTYVETHARRFSTLLQRIHIWTLKRAKIAEHDVANMRSQHVAGIIFHAGLCPFHTT